MTVFSLLSHLSLRCGAAELTRPNPAQMFEKFSISDIDSAGRGGEYTVQAGFGWTNGVVMILASEYGNVLVAPQCPDLLQSAAATSGTTSSSGHNAASSVHVPAAFTAAFALLTALAVL